MFDQTVMSAPEAAMRIGLSRERVIRLVQNRVLPGTRIGERWFIPAADVEAYAARREAEAQPAGAA